MIIKICELTNAQKILWKIFITLRLGMKLITEKFYFDTALKRSGELKAVCTFGTGQPVTFLECCV